MTQRAFHQRSFTLFEVLFVKEDADEETIRQIYKKLAFRTHPDLNGCEEHFKSILRGYSVLSNRTAKCLYNMFGVQRAEEELSGQPRWSDLKRGNTTGVLTCAKTWKKLS